MTNETWWKKLHPWLTTLYLVVALLLLTVSGAGHFRLLKAVDQPFGGFFWAVDVDSYKQVVVISTPAGLPTFAVKADSITDSTHITAVNGQPAFPAISTVYRSAHPGQSITYTVVHNNDPSFTVTHPAALFTLDLWWQNYGLALLAGVSWLIVGFFLLATAGEWSGAVEGITLLPPAMLLLLYSHWGNIQQADLPDPVVQLLWVPAFALLGAAFIHLSLTYRPEAMVKGRRPAMMTDVLPYLPLLALLTYEWCSFLILGHVPMRINFTLSLGYAVIGGLISFVIGLTSLIRVGGPYRLHRNTTTKEGKQAIPPHIRHRLGDLLTLWIGSIGLGGCLGVLPILLSGQTLLPLPTFYTLVGIYPLILLYAIRSLRLLDRLHVTLDQREEALKIQQQTATTLRQTNIELQQATSLLLHADAHLRSILSQRIHDQPKQQALRIRSLLAHWQHKLRVEAERDPEGKVQVQPIIDALGKVRKISEELEGDLRGLQLLVEDVYQRRSLGLKLHLEKLIKEDLPALHPESPLKVQADLWALDALNPELEQTEEGMRIAEAVSYTVTQALLNIYNHAGASYATVRTRWNAGTLEVYIIDDGRGFDPKAVPLEKTSLFKARLKVREAGGEISIQSIPRPQPQHGTTILVRLPVPQEEHRALSGPLLESQPQNL